MRTYPDRPIVSVGAVILKGDSVVLVKRGQPPLKGRWSLPGGVVELGETLEEAVAREVFEETGLAVLVGPVLEVLDRVERSLDGRVEYHYVIIDYLCRTTNDPLTRGSDAADVRWVRLEEVPQHGVTDKVLEVIRKGVDAARHATSSFTGP